MRSMSASTQRTSRIPRFAAALASKLGFERNSSLIFEILEVIVTAGDNWSPNGLT